MNAQNKSRNTEHGDQDRLMIKKLLMRVPVSDDNLDRKIKRAFDLAKSSGHELDLTFVGQAA